MPGDIETDRGKLRREHLVFEPFFKVRQRFVRWSRRGCGAAEKSVLAAGSFSLLALGALDRAVNDCEVLRAPGTQSIHCTGLDQAFEDAFVEEARVNVIDKLVDRVELTEFSSRFK